MKRFAGQKKGRHLDHVGWKRGGEEKEAIVPSSLFLVGVLLLVGVGEGGRRGFKGGLYLHVYSFGIGPFVFQGFGSTHVNGRSNIHETLHVSTILFCRASILDRAAGGHPGLLFHGGAL